MELLIIHAAMEGGLHGSPLRLLLNPPHPLILDIPDLLFYIVSGRSKIGGGEGFNI